MWFFWGLQPLKRLGAGQQLTSSHHQLDLTDCAGCTIPIRASHAINNYRSTTALRGFLEMLGFVAIQGATQVIPHAHPASPEQDLERWQKRTRYETFKIGKSFIQKLACNSFSNRFWILRVSYHFIYPNITSKWHRQWFAVQPNPLPPQNSLDEGCMAKLSGQTRQVVLIVGKGANPGNSIDEGWVVLWRAGSVPKNCDVIIWSDP